jgi:hypothetical protein
MRGLEHAAARIVRRLGLPRGANAAIAGDGRLEDVMPAQVEMYEGARQREAQRRRRTGAPTGGDVAKYAMGQVVQPADPPGSAIEAFERVVMRFGWARDTDKIVFAHTHRPLEDVRGPSGAVRYWNTGSWIYEPDLSSRQAYLRYLQDAWPGTAVLLDTDRPQPRLLRLREHLNPLRQQAARAGAKDAGGRATGG